MLTEVVKLNGYSVLADKAIRLSYVTEIKRDDVVIASSSNEELIIPGQDVSNRESEIQSVCAAIWTQQVIDKYREG
jgi:hypothetical protein